MSADLHVPVDDWFPGVVPANVEFGKDSRLDSTYSLATFYSEQPVGLRLGHAAGIYRNSIVAAGPAGRIEIGPYTCLNCAQLVCYDRITIGTHCLLSWGVVVCDSWLPSDATIECRQAMLRALASDPRRWLMPAEPPRPVVLEDNVWIGFDSVVLPGVRIGEGAVVGCKSTVTADVAPYTIVAGNPARMIRSLDRGAVASRAASARRAESAESA
jgi:acetyltransferase-like isoleucine patch superfamily enzyme